MATLQVYVDDTREYVHAREAELREVLGLRAEESLDMLQRALLSAGLDASLQRSPTPYQLHRALQRAAGEPAAGFARTLLALALLLGCCTLPQELLTVAFRQGSLADTHASLKHVNMAARQAHQFRPRDRSASAAMVLNAQKSPRDAMRLGIARVMGPAAQTNLGRTRQRATQARATRAAVTRSCWMRSWSMSKS